MGFTSKSQIQTEIAALERTLGKQPGSTAKDSTRLEAQKALQKLKAEAALAARNPTRPNLRRAERTAKQTAASLSAQRRAEASRPATPHLDEFASLPPAQGTAFYREHRSALSAEQADLAAWQDEQDRNATQTPSATPPEDFSPATNRF